MATTAAEQAAREFVAVNDRQASLENRMETMENLTKEQADELQTLHTTADQATKKRKVVQDEAGEGAGVGSGGGYFVDVLEAKWQRQIEAMKEIEVLKGQIEEKEKEIEVLQGEIEVILGYRDGPEL